MVHPMVDPCPFEAPSMALGSPFEAPPKPHHAAVIDRVIDHRTEAKCFVFASPDRSTGHKFANRSRAVPSSASLREPPRASENLRGNDAKCAIPGRLNG